MIKETIQEKLKSQWGLQADTMQAFALIRVYDSASKWEWFIYAMNDNDELLCIECGMDIIPDKLIHIDELSSIYNYRGEGLSIDYEFRPRRAINIYKNKTKGVR